MLKEYSEWREARQMEWDEQVATMGRGLRNIRGRVTMTQVAYVEHAVKALRRIEELPEAYVLGIRTELLQMLGTVGLDQTFVYLTFWGMEGRAHFLKIGIAKNVAKRMSDIHGANPMDRLWTYTMIFNTRGEATQVESALLRHMSPDKATGEWVRVAKCSEQACEAIAKSLAELAAQVSGLPVELTKA